jgi:hypothetical protein
MSSDCEFSDQGFTSVMMYDGVNSSRRLGIGIAAPQVPRAFQQYAVRTTAQPGESPDSIEKIYFIDDETAAQIGREKLDVALALAHQMDHLEACGCMGDEERTDAYQLMWDGRSFSRRKLEGTYSALAVYADAKAPRMTELRLATTENRRFLHASEGAQRAQEILRERVRLRLSERECEDRQARYQQHLQAIKDLSAPQGK